MEIIVEFFGSVRIRSGVPRATLRLLDNDTRLRVLLDRVAEEFPRLKGFCIGEDGRLMAGFIVNLDGEKFSHDSTVRLKNGQTVMLLSADVGG